MAWCQAAVSATEFEAQLGWDRRMDLGTLVSGRVESVLVQAGDRVEQGQLLAQLDQRVHQARLASAGADLDKGRSDRDEARRELERTQDLYGRALLSSHDLEVAKIAAKKAEAVFQSARMALVEAQLAAEYSKIVAPFPALVLARMIEPGQYVLNKEQLVPMLTIADSRTLVARLQLAAGQVRSLRVGGKATVHAGGLEVPGVIVGITAGGEGANQAGRPLYAVDVRFSPPPDAGLLAGERVRVVLP